MMLRRRLFKETENEVVTIDGLNYSTSIVANNASLAGNVITELKNYLPNNYYYAIMVSENSSFIENEFVSCIFINDANIYYGLRFKNNTYQERMFSDNSVALEIKAGTKISIYYKYGTTGTILTDKWNYSQLKIGPSQLANTIVNNLNNKINYNIAVLITDIEYSNSELSSLIEFQYIGGNLYKSGANLSSYNGIRIQNNSYRELTNYSNTYQAVISSNQKTLVIYKEV